VTFTKYEKVEKSVQNDSDIEDLYGIPDSSENSTSKDFVWIEPDPDEEAPSDIDTSSGTTATQQTNRHYLVKF